MKIRILDLANWIPPEKLYAEYGDRFAVTRLPETRESLLKNVASFDGYIASLKIRLDEEVLARASSLKAVFTPSTGLDHIDLAAARARGIPVFATKNDRAMLEKITATAEMALALLLGAVRRVPWAHEAAISGDWARERFRGHQLSGKTIGILGLGRLGVMMARYSLALGMKVIACDVLPVRVEGVSMVSFDELLRLSDVISVHLPLNDSTAGILDRAAFEKMKRGVVIVNTARGALIDEAAFLDALESGKVGAAGLDVINGEWMEDISVHPLIRYAREHQNLVISPHVGGTCFEAQEITAEAVFRKIDAYFSLPDGVIPPGSELARSLVNESAQ